MACLRETCPSACLITKVPLFRTPSTCKWQEGKDEHIRCLRLAILGDMCKINSFFFYFVSLMAQTVKRLPTIWEAWVRSLDWEDPLDKEMATYSSTLAWKIPWTEEPGKLQSMGSQRDRLSGHDWATSLLLHFLLCFLTCPISDL